uniref:HDC10113 n=1 Tax=Drosophila melanogaster TaxID=7227 RepID=Q6IL78_DROME|nr:TPA_inf: HDC10113 [Drosophila melanogaster]
MKGGKCRNITSSPVSFTLSSSSRTVFHPSIMFSAGTFRVLREYPKDLSCLDEKKDICLKPQIQITLQTLHGVLLPRISTLNPLSASIAPPTPGHIYHAYAAYAGLPDFPPGGRTGKRAILHCLRPANSKFPQPKTSNPDPKPTRQSRGSLNQIEPQPTPVFVTFSPGGRRRPAERPEIQPCHSTVGGALNATGELNEIPFLILIDCCKRCLTNVQLENGTATMALFPGLDTDWQFFKKFN